MERKQEYLLTPCSPWLISYQSNIADGCPRHYNSQGQGDRQDQRLGNLVLLVKGREDFYHHGKESSQENAGPENPQEAGCDKALFFNLCEGKG